MFLRMKWEIDEVFHELLNQIEERFAAVFPSEMLEFPEDFYGKKIWHVKGIVPRIRSDVASLSSCCQDAELGLQLASAHAARIAEESPQSRIPSAGAEETLLELHYKSWRDLGCMMGKLLRFLASFDSLQKQ